MGLFFASLFLSCLILIIIHIIFVGINSFQWAVNGVDVIIKGNTFIETIYYSSYLKWIGLADIIWLFMLGIFLLNQKRFKTNLNLHYLDYNQIKEPKISVIIPAYNEENNIKQVVIDFIKQKNVITVYKYENFIANIIKLKQYIGQKKIANELKKASQYFHILDKTPFNKKLNKLVHEIYQEEKNF